MLRLFVVFPDVIEQCGRSIQMDARTQGLLHNIALFALR